MDYLGDIFYRSGKSYSAFLYGLHDINYIRGRKAVIMGTCKDSCLCSGLLMEHGINVLGYCTNDKSLCGKTIIEKPVKLSYDLFKSQEYYYIITFEHENRKDSLHKIMNQFYVNNIEDYSIFFIHEFDYLSNVEYRDLLMQANNDILNLINPNPGSLFDVMTDYNIRYPVFGLAQMNLMAAAMCWMPVFDWLYKDLKLKIYNEVLEIGAGNGYLSCLLKKIDPDITLNWITYALDKRTGIENILETLSVNNYIGEIEDPEFIIDKKFHVIIMTEVMEHLIFNPVPTLKKIYDMLDTKGKFYLSTPYPSNIGIWETWKNMKDFSLESHNLFKYNQHGHVYQYSKEELLEIFHSCGFRVEKYALSSNKHHNFVLVK